MGMSGVYGPADEGESLRTVHAALDAGINLLDTGDFYGMGHNEMLLSRVLKDRRQEAFVCVKFGAMRSPEGTFVGMDGFIRLQLCRLSTPLFPDRSKNEFCR
jgi:aryl-alcohol dehydrogenase-like predicted oxidoreductase